MGDRRRPDPRIHSRKRTHPGDTSGLTWELLFAPPTCSGLSFEASVHGNHFGGAQYSGISIGIHFGKLGP